MKNNLYYTNILYESIYGQMIGYFYIYFSNNIYTFNNKLSTREYTREC